MKTKKWARVGLIIDRLGVKTGFNDSREQLKKAGANAREYGKGVEDSLATT